MANVATPRRAPATMSRLADVPDKLFDVFARISGGLHAEEPRIATAQTHQLFVRALLDQASVLEEDDPVGAPDSRETVRDVHRGPAVGQRAQPLEEVVLGLSVERRGRLVEQQ